MQLIRGAPFDRAKADMTLEEKVRAARQIASALHEAHRLGLIHRDVKPSNIMLERADDGAWKPYLMDFGLARDVGDTGRTMTGAILGTPAFMAPEQAAGMVRTLDRRTDVYGLGATLYDVLTGRPPFIADGLLDLLAKIKTDDPLPLRKRDPHIPRDLEAIVLRCLEKDPGARYDSARALGDDLQRFLDGDPVLARRGSLAYTAYALSKRARRHKAAVAVALSALLAALLATALWARARRIAAEQTTLSRELGEDVREMELFLRSAHGMPLHDVERERDIVRTRLDHITHRMTAAGDAGLGPGHYALGRGHLALQEPHLALPHLEAAAASGYRSAGLDYATGLALRALYRQGLDDAKRLQGEQRKAHLAQLDARYKQPALTHLRAALGAHTRGQPIEAPAYVEGLIAFDEERHDDALAKAREAFAAAPWLHEARKLEADVLFAIGSRHGHDAAFDFAQMTRWFTEAADAYRAAADLGRSDPAVHEATCALWTQTMIGTFTHGSPPRPSFDQATTACERAITASPRSPSGYLKLAAAHNAFTWAFAAGGLPDEDPDTVFADAADWAEEAQRQAPDSPMAHYLVGAVFRSQALYASTCSRDIAPAVHHAIAGYEAALDADPTFLWALNERCSSLVMRAQRESTHGEDPEPSLAQARLSCDRAIALDPQFTYPKATRVFADLTLAEHLVTVGASPARALQSATASLDALEQQSPSYRWIPSWTSALHRTEAMWAVASGADIGPALAGIEASARDMERLSPSSSAILEARGKAAALRAQWLLTRDEDPAPALREARRHLTQALQQNPSSPDTRAWSALTEITALRWARRHGAPHPADFDAAFAPLLPLLDEPRADPRLYLILAEIHELRASSGAPPHAAAEDLARGLDRVAQALSINPRLGTALACKGRLLLLRARSLTDAAHRREAAAQAIEALTAAARHNPQLTRSERPSLQEAQRLAAPPGDPAPPR
ncbi:Hypothetical protein CAP_1406 [Chondromyces apiculatus DSM 436]|uniref:Protein kinase domain-containing protein n=2 Tax=Chondromyces apiculatus TaxID=51 RepID=A0A017SU12_9BACT|nr:Hypothetical protein CAP_1406 [Chondromyces apiculatus DSM 436]